VPVCLSNYGYTCGSVDELYNHAAEGTGIIIFFGNWKLYPLYLIMIYFLISIGLFFLSDVVFNNRFYLSF
jgi:hypothetical protein